MKKLLLIFLFVSGLFFGQEKPLFKAISYNDLITFYNDKLQLKNEDLNENINRAKFIVEDAAKKQDYYTEFAFTLILEGLLKAEKSEDKNKSFISVYADPTRYEFYNSENKFSGSVDKYKLEEVIKMKGDKTETYLNQYFYILQK